MSRVTFLNHPQREIKFTQGEKSWVERKVLEHRYGLAEQQIESILEDRRLRVRAAKWARRKASVINWFRTAALAVALFLLAAFWTFFLLAIG